MRGQLGWMARPTPARPGFTLVEMLVVLILMGLAAALVAPVLLAPHHHAATLSDLVASAPEPPAPRREALPLTTDPPGQRRLADGAHPLGGTVSPARVAP